MCFLEKSRKIFLKYVLSPTKSLPANSQSHFSLTCRCRFFAGARNIRNIIEQLPDFVLYLCVCFFVAVVGVVVAVAGFFLENSRVHISGLPVCSAGYPHHPLQKKKKMVCLLLFIFAVSSFRMFLNTYLTATKCNAVVLIPLLQLPASYIGGVSIFWMATRYHIVSWSLAFPWWNNVKNWIVWCFTSSCYFLLHMGVPSQSPVGCNCALHKTPLSYCMNGPVDFHKHTRTCSFSLCATWEWFCWRFHDQSKTELVLFRPMVPFNRITICTTPKLPMKQMLTSSHPIL